MLPTILYPQKLHDSIATTTKPPISLDLSYIDLGFEKDETMK